MSLVKSFACDEYATVTADSRCATCDCVLLQGSHVFSSGSAMYCRACAAGMAPLPDSPIIHYILRDGRQYHFCCVRLACADHCSHMCVSEVIISCFGRVLPQTISECCNFCRMIHRVAASVKLGRRTLPTMAAIERMRVAELKKLRLDILGVRPGFKAADSTRSRLIELLGKLLEDIARASACHHVVE